ncbi:MAG: hypothetical protein NC307_12615 [Roseburia sp.]|nr:hypothetical protein [Roseburia sp.]
MPEQWELKLSDACARHKERIKVESMLELRVQAFNINFGKNEKLFKACQKLKEYAQYVDKVRRCIREAEFPKSLEKSREECIREVIGQVIEECIREGILSDFLRKNRAEALEMSWYEYNEELHIKNERAIAFEEGVEQERKKTEEQKKKAAEQKKRVEEEKRARKRAEQENERLRKEIEKLKAQR